ncbi:L,D-transpeptidase family protein [Nostoc parmelioides]|uniref:L,D-transpeptidase family protein n=1 Tax=Nostoc parmelioides FACHB-3921 TaxID=2692909 RepID=A0ABR8BGQ9_9NOSO|nr:L,D-transpeptidase family protein [Nostoc parmelioides]MBD2253272.1 L,D-transpeptidase family protein [Nostoc parmelioides FACHB-3921]
MAMVRNESVGRMVMFLCFGTAILSLAVHWRITTAQGQFKKPIPSTASRPGGVYQGGLGETAFGAPAPFGATTPDRLSQPQSSTIKSHNKSDTVNQNVALETNLPKKTQLLTPESRKNADLSDQSQLRLSQPAAHRKTSNKLENTKKEVVVDLSDRRTYVYAGDVVIASYPIAIGKRGWETPTGTFNVSHMEHDPIWRHPITGKVFPAGVDSPLGERWIGFWSDGRNKIGFHGTPDTHLLGTAISHGCLRMRNSDVRLLYDQVEVGTPVIVQN